MGCNDCNEIDSLAAYRVVQTIYERNTIPCEERLNGMLVTVIGADKSYLQYMLQGGDPCVNSNWVLYSTGIDPLGNHKTIEEEATLPITSDYLNSRFPTAKEGFKVTVLNLNTTFMKVFGDRWVMTNNVLI